MVKFGEKNVLWKERIEEKVKGWMRNKGKGWVKEEYGMMKS